MVRCHLKSTPSTIAVVLFLTDGLSSMIVGVKSVNTQSSLASRLKTRHPLSTAKLWKYCLLWFALDSENHELRLFVFDRYGLNQRELNLCEMFWALHDNYTLHDKGVERVA